MRRKKKIWEKRKREGGRAAFDKEREFFFRELGRKRLYRESFREEFGAW